MMGVYRDVEVTATYSKRITVFVPDGESTRALVEDEVERIEAELPDTIYDDLEWEETTYKILE